MKRKEKKGKKTDQSERAFDALVGKFSKIQYLMDQRALFDVVEKTPVGICITNKDYIYEYVNPAYCRLYGYPDSELVGHSFTKVVPEEHRAYLMELHDKFMDQEYELEGEWEVVRKDGERIHILASAAYVVDEQFRPKKITFVLDRSKEKIAQEKAEAVGKGIEKAKELAAKIVAATEDKAMVTPMQELLSVLESLSQEKT